MKKQKFSESQIIEALKQFASGRKAEEICRELGVHRATFYAWNKKYSCLTSWMIAIERQ